MAHILKYEEWEINGDWYCNDTSDLCGIAGKWWVPARMLQLPLEEYTQMLISDFEPDFIRYNKEADVLLFSWRSQTKMRKFKNWLNAQARKHQFYV